MAIDVTWGKGEQRNGYCETFTMVEMKALSAADETLVLEQITNEVRKMMLN